MRIILDMDEVLVDFVGGACRAHGITKVTYYNRHHQPGRYALHVGMGMSFEKFNEPIRRGGIEFWEYLKPTPWFHETLELVESMTSDWYLASSPSVFGTACWLGKMRWVKKHFGFNFDRLLITNHKYVLMDDRRTVLIDDHEPTCEAIAPLAGSAILFPTPLNRLHPIANRPLTFVQAQLEEFKKEQTP